VWLGLSAYAIKIIKCWGFDLQRPGGDVISRRSVTSVTRTRRTLVASCSPKSHVQGFVINANAHITVLYELVNGEECIVRLSIKGGQVSSRKSSFGVA
jgi:hypothetical protein